MLNINSYYKRIIKDARKSGQKCILKMSSSRSSFKIRSRSFRVRYGKDGKGRAGRQWKRDSFRFPVFPALLSQVGRESVFGKVKCVFLYSRGEHVQSEKRTGFTFFKVIVVNKRHLVVKIVTCEIGKIVPFDNTKKESMSLMLF